MKLAKSVLRQISLGSRSLFHNNRPSLLSYTHRPSRPKHSVSTSRRFTQTRTKSDLKSSIPSNSPEPGKKDATVPVNLGLMLVILMVFGLAVDREERRSELERLSRTEHSKNMELFGEVDKFLQFESERTKTVNPRARN
jgi:hypothetical protein